MKSLMLKVNQTMKKQEKKNNKGFTLVELIIVIAIIAVLAAVLAPQYIQYVERSRIGVDENTIAEVIHNTEICAVDPTVYDKVTNSTTVVIRNGAAVTSSVTELQTALQKVFSGNIALKSKAYANKKYTVTIAVDENGNITVPTYASDNWSAVSVDP